MHLDERIRTELIDIVRDAGKREVLPRFRKLDTDSINTKNGPDDLVTVADIAAESFITDRIERLLPGATVVGEEAVSENPKLLQQIGTSELCVVIDPIDGTFNYATGSTQFGMLLSVVSRGKTLFGLLYEPVMDDWVSAAPGEGCWFCSSRGIEVQLKYKPPGKEKKPRGFVSFHDRTPNQNVKGITKLFRHATIDNLRCACQEYRAIAFGHAEFKFSTQVNPWDHIAGCLVIEELGGLSETETGRPYSPAIPTTSLLVHTSTRDIFSMENLLAAFCRQ